MCGADDELFLHQAEHLFSMVLNGYLKFIPDASHQGPMENPEKCIELIETFFNNT
jgi:pimeloyl-ACP methyl ester carboxylesterase